MPIRKAAKRELINTENDKRFVRRDEKGHFKECDAIHYRALCPTCGSDTSVPLRHDRAMGTHRPTTEATVKHRSDPRQRWGGAVNRYSWRVRET